MLCHFFSAVGYGRERNSLQLFLLFIYLFKVKSFVFNVITLI